MRSILKYNRTAVRQLQKGDNRMSDNERELLNLIRTHENPGQALDLAFRLMLDFLTRREEPQDTSVGHPRVSA